MQISDLGLTTLITTLTALCGWIVFKIYRTRKKRRGNYLSADVAKRPVSTGSDQQDAAENSHSHDALRSNPTQEEINSVLKMLGGEHHLPVRALKALIGTESTFRQFDISGAPLISASSTSSAIGLGQITKSTAKRYGFDYWRLGVDWRYNLASAAKIYAVGYHAKLNSRIRDQRILAARAYDMYHSWTAGLAPSGLTGKPWESLYLYWYDRFDQS